MNEDERRVLDLIDIITIRSLLNENKRLRHMLWLNHGCEFQYLSEEMKCSNCGVDFENMGVEEISKIWMNKLKEATTFGK